jgi:molybdopterin-guanine dinucleotide biosynthesis protein A
MRSDMKLGGIILAGGRSRRMGSDKCLLTFSRFPLITHLIARLEQSVEEVFLVANETDKLSFLPHTKFKDSFSVPCAFSGLHSGLLHSPYEYNFVLACDLPLFDNRMVDLFRQQVKGETQIVVPKTARGFESLCGLYSKRCIPHMEAMAADNNFAIHELFTKLPTTVIPASAVESLSHPNVFFNMNTPGDYDKALELSSQLDPSIN